MNIRQQTDELQAKYGFGLFPTPAYRPASLGDWRITNHMPAMSNGYLATVGIEAQTVLRRGNKVWMSNGLLERESHSWHVHCAHGVVAVAGLGMGMYAYACAQKAEVELVIVADIDPDIIALMKKTTDFDNWPCRNKVHIIQADALSAEFASQVQALSAGKGVDYFYADIWPNFPAAEAPAQTAHMCLSLKPRAAGWWGQELSFAQDCRRQDCAADEESLQRFFAQLAIPAPMFSAGYLAFCRDAASANGMGPQQSLWQSLKRMLGMN